MDIKLLTDPLPLTQNTNFLSPIQFKMKFNSLLNPNVEYFVQRVALPEISVNGAPYYTPQRNIVMPGDKVEFAPLTVDFIIDEDMTNYREIYHWLTEIVLTNDDSSTDYKARDLVLQTYTSANNVNREIRFVDAIPTSLTSLDFNLVQLDFQYMIATVTFQYSYFKFEDAECRTQTA